MEACSSRSIESDNSKNLIRLQEWSRSQGYKLSERHAYIFYHSCYFEQDKTRDCIKTFFAIRSSTPELFSNRNSARPELQKALTLLNFAVFPVHDPSGYRILFHRLCNFEPSKYVFSDGMKLLMMMVDGCIHLEGPVPGYVMLFDMKGVQSGHLARLNLSLLRKFFQYIQEGMPIRLHAIHIVNVVPLMGKIMGLTKPFMKKELLSLLHLHPVAEDYSALYKFIPKSCLPIDYGGELPNIDELHKFHMKWLSSLNSNFFVED